MLFPPRWTGAAGPGTWLRYRRCLLLCRSPTLSLPSLHPDGPAQSSRFVFRVAARRKDGSPHLWGEGHTETHTHRDAHKHWREGDTKARTPVHIHTEKYTQSSGNTRTRQPFPNHSGKHIHSPQTKSYTRVINVGKTKALPRLDFGDL
ncbi:hypothetical protein H8959_007360 [Pygathrix nigripes]